MTEAVPKSCATCKWYDREAYFADPNDPVEDQIGECGWPADRLPFSLRYGNRERMATSPIDGATCPAHEEKITCP